MQNSYIVLYEPYFLNLNLITVNYKLIVDYNFIHIVRLYYEIKISLPKEICYYRLERGGGVKNNKHMAPGLSHVHTSKKIRNEINNTYFLWLFSWRGKLLETFINILHWLCLVVQSHMWVSQHGTLVPFYRLNELWTNMKIVFQSD